MLASAKSLAVQHDLLGCILTRLADLPNMFDCHKVLHAQKSLTQDLTLLHGGH